MNDMEAAKKRWELENEVTELDKDLYSYEQDEQDRLWKEKPWIKDEAYFTTVRISAVALIKMVMHVKSGGRQEVMGYMQGKLQGRSFVIMDSFALPVEGTETRVEAREEADQYAIQYTEMCPNVYRNEGAVGWYHSHPEYGCYLSGIDVQTQRLHQSLYPFVAIVLDPIRTMATGKVEIGAFRVYSSPDKAPQRDKTDFDLVPEDKVEDFGYYWNHYYPLKIETFKSSVDTRVFDSVWAEHWVATLASTPLVSHRDHLVNTIRDVVKKSDKRRRNRCGEGQQPTQQSCRMTVTWMRQMAQQMVKLNLFAQPASLATPESAPSCGCGASPSAPKQQKKK
eukprot:GHVU01209770.1.p1 GENE.GHVU01209770.1~~GHVU01209770.1.p1  ORF type:complete len:338 (-),score=76.19 GHVU01209770.1:317-1330(-)